MRADEQAPLKYRIVSLPCVHIRNYTFYPLKFLEMRRDIIN